MIGAAGRLGLVAGLWLAAVTAVAAGTVAEVETRAQVKVRYLSELPASGATATVVMLAGGHGNIGLSAEGALSWGADTHLIRERATFAGQGFQTVVSDIASDLKQGDAAKAGYRWSDAHVADIGAVIKAARAQAPGKPVVLMGTSRAALSVFAAAARLSGDAAPDAIVVTSGMLVHIRDDQPSVDRQVQGLAGIKQPILLVAHEADQCVVTPPSSPAKLKPLLSGAKKVDIVTLSGGQRGTSDPCEQQSPHGFFGLDDVVAGKISDWIKGL